MTDTRAPAPVSETGTQRSSNAVSWLVMATMFVIGTDTFLVAPMLPVLAENFDVSLGRSGWMVSAYALGFASFALVAGPLSDGRDRKRVMLLGFGGFIATTALCGVAFDFWSMLVFRFLAGMCAALVSPQIWAAIPSLVPGDKIIKAMGFAGAGMSISQVVGVPIGSWLTELSWRAPFFAVSAVAVVVWLVLTSFLPSLPSQGSGQGFVGTYKVAFASPRLKWLLLGYLLYQFAVFGTFSFIGTWFERDFGLSVASVGTAMIALGLGMAITSLFGSGLIQRLGHSRSLLLVFVVMIVAYGSVQFAPNVQVAVLLLMAGSAGLGLGYPLFMAVLVAEAPAARGTISSLATTTLYVATLLGGVTGGLLLERFSGFHGVSTASTISFVLALVVFAAFGAFRERRDA